MYSEAETKFPPPPEEGAPPPPVGPAVGAESDGPPAVLAAEGLVGASSGLAVAVDMMIVVYEESGRKTVGEDCYCGFDCVAMKR
jgi:hypothetical protein